MKRTTRNDAGELRNGIHERCSRPPSKAFDQGDLNGVLSDYAPGAVLFTKDGARKGIDAIRPLFEALIAEFGKPGATFNMKQQLVEGDYAYILWTAKTLKITLTTRSATCSPRKNRPTFMRVRVHYFPAR